MQRKNTAINRRDFIRSTAKGAVAGSLLVGAFPTIVSASVLGKNAPSNRINIAALGNGRISRSHDMPNILKYDTARIIAVADVDSKRVNDAKKMVNDFYSKKEGKTYDGVTTYGDYREALQNKDVDAVVISTPDPWHALMAIHAVEAGKDVYLQKPTSLTIDEGRAVSNAVHRSGRIFQIGTQQRSSTQFRYACELVRNGRIGDLHSVEVAMKSLKCQFLQTSIMRCG